MYKFLVGTLIALGLGYFVYLRVLKGNKAVSKKLHSVEKDLHKRANKASKTINKKVGR